MTNIWLVAIAVIVGVVILGAIAGVIRNLLRMVIAVAIGFLVPAAVYYGATALGYADRIPEVAYIIIGIASAAFVLLRRSGRR